MQFLINLHPLWQTIIATSFTFLATGFGSAIIFFVKKFNKDFFDTILSFSAGIMLAAAFFSLLIPALEMNKQLNMSILIIIIGILLGTFLLYFGNKIFDFYEKKYHKNKINSYKKSIMLAFSITLHNIPEGLAVGVAFALSKQSLVGSSFISSVVLALGIALQNIPEGLAISIPFYKEGLSKKNAFLLGTLSGIVEPISAVLGMLLVTKIKNILPFFLAFAAGAMIYVVIKEIIPESQTNKNNDLMTLFAIIGFTIMMILSFIA